VSCGCDCRTHHSRHRSGADWLLEEDPRRLHDTPFLLPTPTDHRTSPTASTRVEEDLEHYRPLGELHAATCRDQRRSGRARSQGRQFYRNNLWLTQGERFATRVFSIPAPPQGALFKVQPLQRSYPSFRHADPRPEASGKRSLRRCEPILARWRAQQQYEPNSFFKAKSDAVGRKEEY